LARGALVRMPCGGLGATGLVGVLRLRSWFALRTSYCAQDDRGWEDDRDGRGMTPGGNLGGPGEFVRLELSFGYLIGWGDGW
jgi:hypothetical protein